MIDKIAFAIFGFFDKLGEFIDRLFHKKNCKCSICKGKK